MNCPQVRRYLYAFADGELEVKDSCEVLDHLKMCESCARIVADQQALRGGLRRVTLQEPVPALLCERFVAELNRSRRAAPSLAFRAARAVAIAAGVALAVGVAWWYWPETAPVPHINGNSVPGRLVSVSPVVQKVVTRHCACVNSGRQHQCATLPDTLEGLRGVVAQRFGGTLDVLVPDLRDNGFQFESVNTCGIDSDRSGLHIIYVEPRTEKRLSLFCVPRCKMRCKKHCVVGRHDYNIEKAALRGTCYAVAGWQCPRGRSSYFACGDVEEDQLVTIADAARIAMARGEPVIRLAILNPP